MTAETMILEPIVVDGLPDADYRAHRALSSSSARKLLPPYCPAIFAWERAHPPESRPVFDLGHAAHQLVLGAGQPIVRIEAGDWRTKAAKDAREEAYAAGSVPLLQAEHDTVLAMAKAIEAHPLTSIVFDRANGRPEQSIFWPDVTEGGVAVDRKARIDWLMTRGARPLVVDYKSTVSADPGSFAKSVANYGYFQQGAWYLDAAAAIGYTEAAFLLVAQEKTPPFLVSIFELDQDALMLGRERNQVALQVYVDCLGSDTWPGYSDEVQLLSLPGWAYKAAL